MPPRKRKAKAQPKTRKGPDKTAATTPKRAKFDFFNFTINEIDPIIENLREVSQKYKQNKSLDNEILDQISLEGLTGLTFGHLCRLLDAAIPNLNCAQDDQAQDYIWSVIVNCYMRRVAGASVQAHYLKTPTEKRQSKSVNNKIDNKAASSSLQQDSESPSKSHLIIDKEIKLPSHTLKRIAKTDWMLHPVQDGATMGSCAHYLARKNITREILDLFDASGPRVSLHELNKKYDLKNIYLVADQELRRSMLLPPTYDPNMDIKLREYACLELIGRTRCLGIVFPNDKSLGRYRILLTAKKLITQFQQTCNSYIVHHIKRFSQFNLELEGKPFKNGVLPLSLQKPVLCADDHDDELDSDGEQPTVRNTCCNPRRLKIDCDMLRMVYDVIALSRGRSMLDIRVKLKIPKSHVRNHLKNLANIGLIGSHTRVIGEKMTRIYRAKHKSNRRKLVRKKILQGVRSRWDEIDIRAKEMLGHRRSHFSQAEDSLLILCRITCLLMEPNLKKLSFCVPKHLIRDTLHDELFESHDKTSDSLLRRTKFLRHLPLNKMLINELVAELRDDGDIVRLAQTRQEAKSDEKLCKLFKQLLRAVRAKLPHLLGLTSSLITNSSRTISIKSRADLKEKFELVDCQMPMDGVDAASAVLARAASKLSATSGPTSSSCLATSTKPTRAKRATSSASSPYHQPTSTLIQLAQPIDSEVKLDLVECKGMKSILNLASFCSATLFNLNLELKVPVRVVGLDQDNESFKDIFERAKESKETSRIIADLTTPNPTADSRRALFMLRNALKLQTLEKCGKLADALIVRPCDIRFCSNETVVFTKRSLVEKFIASVSESKTMASDVTSATRRIRGDQASVEHGKIEASTSKANQPKDGGREREVSSSAREKCVARKQVLKMIEFLLSWISVYPGIELGVLKVKTMVQMGGSGDGRQLLALLDLMEQLELISSERLCLCDYDGGAVREPRLFGYCQTNSGRSTSGLSKRPPASGGGAGKRRRSTGADDDGRVIITYEPQANAYVRYCQLVNIDL